MMTVNDLDGEITGPFWRSCGICGEPADHQGVPHSEATGDGLTRYDIVDFMRQGGYSLRSRRD